MVIFHCYVSSPEGISKSVGPMGFSIWVCHVSLKSVGIPKWRFPKSWVPLNHRIFNRIFHHEPSSYIGIPLFLEPQIHWLTIHFPAFDPAFVLLPRRKHSPERSRRRSREKSQAKPDAASVPGRFCDKVMILMPFL